MVKYCRKLRTELAPTLTGSSEDNVPPILLGWQIFLEVWLFFAALLVGISEDIFRPRLACEFLDVHWSLRKRAVDVVQASAQNKAEDDGEKNKMGPHPAGRQRQ